MDKFGYDASEEILELSDPHWFTFEPVHPYVQHVVALVYLLLFSVCATGNLLVIMIFLKRQSRRNPSCLLIAALAFSDLTLISTQAPPLFIGALLSKYWAFGRLGCQIYAFIGGLTGCTSIWLIVFIGYDLNDHLTNRTELRRGVSTNTALLMIAFAYSFSFVTNVPPFLGWGDFKPEGLLLSCSFDYLSENVNNKSFVLFLTLVDFVLPMFFVVYYYSSIALAVADYRRKERKVVKYLGLSKKVIRELSKTPLAEARISRVCFSLFFVWFAAWCPYTVVCLIGQFGNKALITPLVSQLPALFAKTASCINPIVFSASHPNFRKQTHRRRMRKDTDQGVSMEELSGTENA